MSAEEEVRGSYDDGEADGDEGDLSRVEEVADQIAVIQSFKDPKMRRQAARNWAKLMAEG